MRIVGGIYKGRTLVEFGGDEIRPTSDKVRESLFNILRDRVQDCRFLDLFCGTGAMGIEALSRGAKEVVINDLSNKSLGIAKKNLEKLKINQITVTNYDASTCLLNTTSPFDIIYIDPPYKSDYGLKALDVAVTALKDDGIVVYENEKPFEGEVKNLVKYDERKYGRAYITFFKKGE